MKTILVTGASGQLGQCFKKIAHQYPDLDFIFRTSAELDVTNKLLLQKEFAENKIDFCINCAAYTNVEKAESEKEKAYQINAEAVKKLAGICKESGVVLIHFSTDYVFDGKASSPYREEDATNPINVYGASKLLGEKHITETLDRFYIFRTSWLYSEFGNNFYKTILRKAGERATLNITTSQKGTPTNANDLAGLVLQLIAEEKEDFGLYHYSNLGNASWYDFAKAILEISHKLEQVEMNPSDAFKTLAARPHYSILDKSKVLRNLTPKILHWRESLEQLIKSQNS